MVDIFSATQNATLPTTAVATGGSALINIPVSLIDTPQALDTLVRALQMGASFAAEPQGGTLTLATALGLFTVSLAQKISQADKQNLTQQLMNLFESQRPLTLTVQPGSPPTKGALLIPNLSPAAMSPQPLLAGTEARAVLGATFAPSAVSLPPPVSAGDRILAIVLPAAVADKTTDEGLRTGPSGQASLSPAAYAPATASLLATRPPQPTAPVVTSGQSLSPSIPVFAPSTVAPTASPITVTQPVGAPVISVQPALVTTPPARAALSILPAPAPALSALPPPGHEVVLHIVSVIPPPPRDAAPPPVVSSAGQIVATVKSSGDGQLILQSGETPLFVKTPVTASVGSLIVATLDTPRQEPLLPLPLADSPRDQQQRLQSLPQMLAALAQQDPQLAQNFIASRLPQPSDALPGALLLLLGAFKRGGAKAWLGAEVTESLSRAAKSEVIEKIAKEFETAVSPARDPVVGEWRSYPIPLFVQQQFQNVSLYVHADADARQEAGSRKKISGKIRFVIDMSLSKLGAMQLDGFVQAKKLDMILRSESSLPEGLHHNLRLAYIKALTAVDYSGNLNFQVGRQNWMTMQRGAVQGIVT